MNETLFNVLSEMQVMMRFLKCNAVLSPGIILVKDGSFAHCAEYEVMITMLILALH